MLDTEPLRRNLSNIRRRVLEETGNWTRSQPARDEVADLIMPKLAFDDGVFVEAGAHDGFFQSNTYLLERKRGWTGVLVEPVPDLARRARRLRRRSRVVNCALVEDDYPDATMTLHHAGPMSIQAGTPGADEWAHRAEKFGEAIYDFTVPARTLSSVLGDAGVRSVDFLSLDVEGFEASVLRGLDFDRFAPRLALIEVVGEGGDHRADIEAVLGQRYRPVGETSVDVLYELRH